ncbi:unnamed protein product [Parajaminaea phylloscopi]
MNGRLASYAREDDRAPANQLAASGRSEDAVVLPPAASTPSVSHVETALDGVTGAGHTGQIQQASIVNGSSSSSGHDTDSDDDDDDDDDLVVPDVPTLYTFPPSDRLPLYVCAKCGTHLALQDEIISKAFSGHNGKAYLFHSSINTYRGAPESRRLLTGMHTVADLKCRGCDALVGWTYLRAWEGSQKYKEGRFILEQAAVHKINNWS